MTDDLIKRAAKSISAVRRFTWVGYNMKQALREVDKAGGPEAIDMRLARAAFAVFNDRSRLSHEKPENDNSPVVLAIQKQTTDLLKAISELIKSPKPE